jgi:hypothetical protein
MRNIHWSPKEVSYRCNRCRFEAKPDVPILSLRTKIDNGITLVDEVESTGYEYDIPSVYNVTMDYDAGTKRTIQDPIVTMGCPLCGSVR